MMRQSNSKKLYFLKQRKNANYVTKIALCRRDQLPPKGLKRGKCSSTHTMLFNLLTISHKVLIHMVPEALLEAFVFHKKL